MDDRETVNFLKPKGEFTPSLPPEPSLEHSGIPKRKKPLLRAGIFLTALCGVGFLLFSFGIAKTAPSDIEGSVSFFGMVRHLVGANDRTSSASADDRINILLLGIGGAGHAGAELTDTMILGSFKPSTGEVGMISIPRDLTLSIPDYGYTKINAVNAYAEQDAKGSGIKAIASVIEEVMGERIDYTVKVDFSGFAEIIDAIGGIDVYVDRDFSDDEYPILGMEDASCTNASPTEEAPLLEASPYGCRYEVLSFTQGWTHMDGATALKYARSRHGNNGEGSDFARAARQQKVLLAWKEKALSLGVLLNPGKLKNIVGVVNDNVTTTMSLWDMMDLARYADDIRPDALASHVIDGQSGLVYSSTMGAAYVLLPRKEDWSEFHALADNIFATSASSTALSTAPAQVPTPHVIVEIQNGTTQAGLASQTAQLLQSSGYGVVALGNANEKTWTTTTIFDFTDGKKDTELSALKDYLNADVVMTSKGAMSADELAPDRIEELDAFSEYRTALTCDFLIILGENSGKLVLSSSYVR